MDRQTGIRLTIVINHSLHRAVIILCCAYTACPTLRKSDSVRDVSARVDHGHAVSL